MSDERLAVPQVESVESQRVESVGNACAETGKQDDEAIERGESVGTEGSSGHIEGQGWKDILDTVSGYKAAVDVEKDIEEEEDTFYSVFLLEDMPLMQRQDPELAKIITYLSTGDLPMSDKDARKILYDERSVHDG